MNFTRRIASTCAVGAIALIGTWQIALAESLIRDPVGLIVPDRLTDDEMSAFSIAVQRCWNVGSVTTEALRITITVGFTLDRDGKPDRQSIAMVAFDGGSPLAAQQVFEAARRAILVCGRDGYDLPADKYDVWKDVSIVFDLKGMRTQ